MKKVSIFVFASILVVTLAVFVSSRPLQAQGDEAMAPKQIIPTYEVMEILFEREYDAMKENLAAEPDSRKVWRELYNSTYALAELTNILYSRSDEDYMSEPDWVKHIAETRAATEALGEVVKERDYANVKTKFEALRVSCNACHTRFEGEDGTVLE